MAKPRNKQELLSQSEENFTKLFQFILSLDEEDRIREFPEGYLNRSIRDVLGHLHEWHNMMLSWYEIGSTGQKPGIPAKGYTWKTTLDLNKEIQRKYSTVSLREVENLLRSSHKKIQTLIEKHTNEQLFEKKRYAWTGTTSLGAYLISATSSHYDWALKLIKKCLK
ncbi:MAG: ClbS/DfsB family four-helix bundle protein [Balneola sp.]